MRKRMQTVPFDPGLQEGSNPSQLTVGDVHEIVLMKQLKDDNIVKLQDVVDVADEDRLYIVLKLFAECSIHELIQVLRNTLNIK